MAQARRPPAGPGNGIVPLAGGYDHKEARPVRSIGIQKPVGPQSVVVKTLQINKAFQRSRVNMDPAGMLAPVGSPAAHDIVPHDIIITRKSDSKYTSLGYPHEVAVACVNGIYRSEADEWMFGGIAKTLTSNEKGATSDNLFVAVVTGTATTINTGSRFINPGQKVWVSVEPWVIRRGDGIVVPAVEQPGVPRDKFRPQTLPWEWLTPTAEMAVRLRNVNTAMHAQFGQRVGTSEISRDMIADVFDRLELPQPGGAARRAVPRAVSPVDMYTATMALKKLRSMLEARYSPVRIIQLPADANAQAARYVASARAVYEFGRDWFQAHGATGHSDETTAQYTRLASAIANTLRPLVRPDGNAAAFVGGDFTTAHYNNIFEADTRLELLLDLEELRASADFRALAERWIIGTAMDASPPGQPLNINLGYST